MSPAAALIASGGSPSLMRGWLPYSIEIVAAAALGGLVAWRFRRIGARFAVALAVGLASALAARWALHDLGITGEIAPWSLWGWTAATGFALTVALMGWRASGWWSRNAAVFAASFCLLSTGLVVNGWIGYFPTVAVAWNQVTGQPLPHQIDWRTADAMRLRSARPRHGQLVAIDTGSAVSGFRHRTEWVYLPPAWFDATGAAVPAVMMIGGEFTTTADWVRAGQAATTADRYAEAHDGKAPMLVFADANGDFTNDTECVNGPRGRAADHLTEDVIPAVVSRFGASATPSHWAVAGFSAGGTCAVDLATMHPELFGSFVDIAGDDRPNAGNPAQTTARLYGGDGQAWTSFDPVSVIARHGPYAHSAGLFIVPDSSLPDGGAAHRLCGAGALQGIRCSVVVLPGRHTWPFAAAAFERALPWLAVS